jgi:hypothetical protein
MDADRFDGLTRRIGSLTTRRRAVGLVAASLLAIPVPAAEAARCSKRKPCRDCYRCTKRGRCKKKIDGAACPDGTCANGVCAHVLVACTNTGTDPVCSGDSANCACTHNSGGTRYCGTYGGADKCATATQCGPGRPACPAGYFCDSGSGTGGRCPDNVDRCAKNCGVVT